MSDALTLGINCIDLKRVVNSNAVHAAPQAEAQELGASKTKGSGYVVYQPMPLEYLRDRHLTAICRPDEPLLMANSSRLSSTATRGPTRLSTSTGVTPAPCDSCRQKAGPRLSHPYRVSLQLYKFPTTGGRRRFGKAPSFAIWLPSTSCEPGGA